MPNQPVRLAVEGDQSPVMDLYRACSAADPSAGWNEYYPNDEILMEDIGEQSLFLYESEKELIGVFTLHATDEIEEMDLAYRYQDNPCIISRLCISPSMQGRGFGKILLEAAENHARAQGHHCIHLLCDVINLKANRLYQMAGYEHVCEAALYGNRYNVLEKSL